MANNLKTSETPPIEDSISNFADWVEMRILLSEVKSFNLRDVISMGDEYADEENADFCEQDGLNEDKESQLAEEFHLRGEVLGETYPFSLSDKDSRLCIDMHGNIGEWIYLYCLLISHPKPDGVSGVSLKLSNSDRDLLQIASVFATYGHLGFAYSFGWPRPEGDAFLPALKKVCQDFGEGTVLDKFKPGYSPYTKDGEVDVIGWQHMNDGMPGKIFLLGQVASGENWEDKSILGAIKYFKDSYFSDTPKSYPIPAMFIPFCIEKKFGGERRDVMNRLTQQYGIIYHRLRLPYFANRCVDAEKHPPRWDESDKFKQFVEDVLGCKLLQTV